MFPSAGERNVSDEDGRVHENGERSASSPLSISSTGLYRSRDPGIISEQNGIDPFTARKPRRGAVEAAPVGAADLAPNVTSPRRRSRSSDRDGRGAGVSSIGEVGCRTRSIAGDSRARVVRNADRTPSSDSEVSREALQGGFEKH